MLIVSAVACLILAGCLKSPVVPNPPPVPTPSDLVSKLNVAVAATDAAVVGLTIGGVITPETGAAIVAAVALLPGISQQIVAELSSADSDIARASKITALLNPVLANIKALPPTARLYVSAALAAWEAFLAAYPVPVASTNLQAVRSRVHFDAKALNQSLQGISKLERDIEAKRKP